VNDELRIGDAEREAAAGELGEHFAMGRITAEEHGDRLEQIWTARTAADLRPVFHDLPRPRPAQPPRPASSSGGTTARPWWPAMPRLGFPLKALIAIVVLMVVFHHLWFLLLAVVVYACVVRRFTHRSRWARFHGGYGGPYPGRYGGRSRAGWQ
jgi:hypothetical protein